MQPSQPGPALTPQQKLAAGLEARFAELGQSLTDESTAEVFLTTLRAVRGLLEGAHAQGVIGSDEFRTLDEMIAGMMGVPALLG